jgi:cell division protein FtsB
MENKEQNTIATPEYKAVSLAKNYLRDKSQDASIMSAQVSRLIHVIESSQPINSELTNLKAENERLNAEIKQLRDFINNSCTYKPSY